MDVWDRKTLSLNIKVFSQEVEQGNKPYIVRYVNYGVLESKDDLMRNTKGNLLFVLLQGYLVVLLSVQNSLETPTRLIEP